MSSYHLSAEAENDLEAIYLDGLNRFGLSQADAYLGQLLESLDRLASFPHMAPERFHLGAVVRVHPFRTHLIVYDDTTVEGAIFIVRIRHSHEDYL